MPNSRRRRPHAPTLFLGGPWHGQRREVDGATRTLSAPIPQPPEIIDYANAARAGIEPHPSSGLATMTYTRRFMGFGRVKKSVSIFVPSGWTDVDCDYALACWIESGT